MESQEELEGGCKNAEDISEPTRLEDCAENLNMDRQDGQDEENEEVGTLKDE